VMMVVGCNVFLKIRKMFCGRPSDSHCILRVSFFFVNEEKMIFIIVALIGLVETNSLVLLHLERARVAHLASSSEIEVQRERERGRDIP
jgi:hypothetical protein